MSEDFSTLFDFLPVGAYRSLPDGTQLRANPALVRLNGYTSEAEMLAAVGDIAREWYVNPGRRALFRTLMERDGHVRAFVSQVYRHRTRERIWISENAHVVRDGQGAIRWYEGTVEDISERVAQQSALADSEARLRRIAAQVPGIVFQVHVGRDGQRRYLFISEGVQALAGVTPEAVLADSRQLDGLIDVDDRARLDHERTLADAAGQPLVSEFRLHLPGGPTRWLRLHAAPMGQDAEGTLRSGVMIDVSAHKTAETELRLNEERWKLALEATGDGVWDWDLETGIEVFSPRFMQMYGYEATEFVTRADDFDHHVHPEDIAQMARDRAAHFEGRTPSYVNEHRVRCRDGRWKWVLTRGLVIRRDGGGRPLRIIGTHTDITERREADALRAERNRAAAADQAKTELLSRISHELRTPLNALLGFAQLLEIDGATAPHQRAWVQQMLASGRHLLGLVDDVLDLSSSQSGGFRLVCSAVDVGSTLAQSWSMLQAEAARQRISLVDGLRLAAPLAVSADPQRLRQVLSNLLSNAVKYNRPGGRVVFDAARRGDVVVMSISDSGRGFDDAQRERVFRPFERLGAQTSGIEGTGLGLAVARQLVEAMQGTITLQSTPGVGSTFTVTLPVAGTVETGDAMTAAAGGGVLPG